MSKKLHLTLVAAAILAGAALSSVADAATTGKISKEAAAILAVKPVLQGQQTQIRFPLSQAISKVPEIFAMTNPHRIVFDVPGATNATGQRAHEVAAGPVKGVSVIQAQGVARVIVDLKTGARSNLELQGNELVLTLGEQVQTVAQSKPVDTSAAAAAAPERAALAALDFRRGPSGEGRVVVDLSSAAAGVDVRKQGNTIVAEFEDAQIADNLVRRINVTDFGTPVNAVNVTRAGKGVRMVIEPKGLWEYNAYQTDARFVIEVRPVTYEENKLVQGSAGGYKGERMSLNFQNVDVRNLISVIADFTKLNIVASDTVQGTMTVRLQDVPWDQALDIILQSRGLDMRKSGNVIMVAPAEEIAKREKSRMETAAQTRQLEPMRTEPFQLNYAKTDDVIKLLTNKDQRLLSERGSVVADPRTNQLFVQDNALKLEEVAKIIKKIDVPVRQVLIEARIVEAGDKFSRALGARLGFVQSTPSRLLGGPTRAMIGSTISGTGYLSGQVSDIPDFLTQGTNVNLPSPGLDSGAQAGQFAVTLLNGAGTKFLNLELSALEADGRGKIVSSPSVVTADKEKALIEQGTELPYLEASASGAATVSFKKANLKLEVVPHITPDGNVIMAVDINKDAPGAATLSGIAIDTKHVKTKVLVENGGTVVIGGIFTQDERNDVNKVPFLGDLPAIGNLFKNTVKKDTKTELMIFLTPRVLETRVGATN